MKTAPPTPVPSVIARKSVSPRAAPKCHSATPMQLASFSATAGSPLNSRSILSRKTSSHPGTLVSSWTRPVAASTNPGTPTPTAADPDTSRARREIRRAISPMIALGPRERPGYDRRVLVDHARPFAHAELHGRASHVDADGQFVHLAVSSSTRAPGGRRAAGCAVFRNRLPCTVVPASSERQAAVAADWPRIMKTGSMRTLP